MAAFDPKRPLEDRRFWKHKASPQSRMMPSFATMLGRQLRPASNRALQNEAAKPNSTINKKFARHRETLGDSDHRCR